MPATAMGAIGNGPMAPAVPQPAGPQLEKLDRGVVSVHTATGNRVSWRQLADDPGGGAASLSLNGVPCDAKIAVSSVDVPVQIPRGGSTPSGEKYTYTANDVSVSDLDGDGQYEIVLKWDPTNAHDNSQAGYTGNVYLDAYKLNGTRLWRIDLGRNIRAGAH